MAGQLRVDEITDEAGTGSPSFPFGLPVGYAAGGTAPAAGSFTEVPSNVLEVGDPIRSSDIIAIKDNTLFLFDASFGFPIIDQQRFDASGTWTKAANVNNLTDSLICLLVGGGGSGVACRLAGSDTRPGFQFASGGGCSVVICSIEAANIPATCSITIGAGGTSVSVSSGESAGVNGGATTIDAGGGITASANGGGGGNVAVGANPAIGGGGGGTVVAPFRDLINKSKSGRSAPSSFQGNQIFPRPVFGGGGSFSIHNFVPLTGNVLGGPSFEVFPSFIIGSGGSGGEFTAATSGATIGGGGGGAAAASGTATSGAGAAGGAIIFTVRGMPSSTVFNEKNTQIP